MSQRQQFVGCYYVPEVVLFQVFDPLRYVLKGVPEVPQVPRDEEEIQARREREALAWGLAPGSVTGTPLFQNFKWARVGKLFADLLERGFRVVKFEWFLHKGGPKKMLQIVLSRVAEESVELPQEILDFLGRTFEWTHIWANPRLREPVEFEDAEDTMDLLGELADGTFGEIEEGVEEVKASPIEEPSQPDLWRLDTINLARPSDPGAPYEAVFRLTPDRLSYIPKRPH